MPIPQKEKKWQCQRRANGDARQRNPQLTHSEPAPLCNYEYNNRDARNEDISPSECSDVSGGCLLQQERYIEAVRRKPRHELRERQNYADDG